MISAAPSAAAGMRLGLRGGSPGGLAEVSTELPVADQSIGQICLEGLPALSLRDGVALMLACRRALQPGGNLIVSMDEGGQRAGLAHWAALVGLHQPVGDDARVWQKPLPAEDETPLVSILIPAWNPRYFSACLGSALAQTYGRIEIIVCDDSEGDRIERTVAAHAGAVPVNYRRNGERLYTRRNYEKLLDLARGEFIKFLNDDDVLAPTCVERLLEPLRNQPGLSLAISPRQPIDANGRPLPDIPATRLIAREDLVIDGISLANTMIMYGLNLVGEPSTMLMRKRDFLPRLTSDVAGVFHFNGIPVRGAIDFAMAARALVQGDAAFVAARLSGFRQHPEQAQRSSENMRNSEAGIRALQAEWIRLGLFRSSHPNVIETRKLAGGLAAGGGWQPRHVLGFPATGQTPGHDQRIWRAIKSHPFDQPTTVP